MFRITFGRRKNVNFHHFYRLHGLVTARQQDKNTMNQLERRLQEERRYRNAAESQLTAERKAKKAEEAATARAVAMAAANAR